MRALLAAFALTLVLPLGSATAQEPADLLSGTWELTFTPQSVRAVGTPLRAEAAATAESSCGSEQCGSSYRFTDQAGEPIDVLVRFDGLEAVGFADGGFRGPVTVDGTTYRVTGKWFYDSAYDVAQFLPEGTDTLTFTVSGPYDDPSLSGTMTALFGYGGPTADDGTHTDITGYEVYTGTISGRPTPTTLATRGAEPPGVDEPPTGGGEDRPVALEARADDVAARAHTRPVLSTRVATARQLPWAPSKVAVSAFLALLLVVLMPFPAALFNATLEQNYDEVRGWLRLGPRRRPEERAPATWPRFVLLIVGVAALGSLLDPSLAFDSASLALVAGVAIAALVVSVLAAAPGHLYVRRRYGAGSRLALYPLGLAVAAFCVLVSRLTSFEPGYLYGVVAGIAVVRELRTDEEGRISLTTSALLLAVAGGAFALRLPVHDAVLEGGGWGLTLLDTALAAVFAAGVEANVLGLLPLRFLPGDTLYRWSRVVWSVVFGINLFAFLHTLSAAAGTASTGSSVKTAAVLFGVFGAVSVSFWAYFRFRPQPTPAASG